MNIPKIDSMGKVIFPQDKQITKSEFEGFFIPAQEKTDVGNNTDPADNHDIDSELESEQTADLEDQQEKNNGNH